MATLIRSTASNNSPFPRKSLRKDCTSYHQKYEVKSVGSTLKRKDYYGNKINTLRIYFYDVWEKSKTHLDIQLLLIIL